MSKGYELEDIVKETRAAFIIAKADGVLDAGEVIKIAVDLAQKVQKVANLSGSEKKALLLHTLKKGLDDDGGVDSLMGMKEASPETKEAFKNQLIVAASCAIDIALDAAAGKLDLRKPSSWKSCIPLCLNLAKTVVPPKQQKLLDDAVAFTKTVLPNEEPATAAAAAPAATEAVVFTLPGAVADKA